MKGKKVEGYEYLDAPMPVVGIVCKDEKGEEEIIVIKDCVDPDGPVWNIEDICEACEDAFVEWLGKR